MHIVNISNNRIKEISKLHQKKYRDETGLFIAEGIKALEEIIASKIEIVDIYAVQGTIIPYNNIKISYIAENEMKKISTTSSACEILTIAKKVNTDINNFKNIKKIALFENISDPGNLGTILRSASAFGVEGIILLGDCVELYSPKVVRSAAGNFFKTPVVPIKNNTDLKSTFSDYKFIATSLSKTNNIEINTCKSFDKYIIMFGSEAKGLTKELTDISDYNIKLEMKNNVESLNLSVSASIIFYELI